MTKPKESSQQVFRISGGDQQLDLLDLLSPALPSGLTELRSPDEIYDALSTATIPVFVENRRVERKGGNVQPKVLGEYPSMWANTQPDGGVLLVGVENNGKISGLKRLGNEKKNELEYLSTFCSDARWTSKELEVTNDKGEQDFILAYRVAYREDKVVETSAGRAFVREGSTKVEMSPALRRELGIAKGEIRYELEQSRLDFPEEFNQSEIAKFCKAFSEYRRLTEPKSDVEILQLAKLGKIRNGAFVPNLACALIFAGDPCEQIPGARIRILRYNGMTEKFGNELNVIFDTYAEGAIPLMLEEARRLVASQVRSYQRLSGTRLERRLEYPEAAWFEAIVNAVGHRSYNFTTQNIFVKMFDDRIVIESPGGFVPPTTAQSIYESHNPRNPVLMDAMMHMQITHCGYEGTRRMRNEMNKAHLPAPKFMQIEANTHKIHVILHNTPIDGDSADGDSVVVQIDTDELSQLEREERQIIAYLAEHDFITIKTAGRVTGRSWPTAQKYVQKLLYSGIIELIDKKDAGSAPKKSYRLTRRRGEKPS